MNQARGKSGRARIALAGAGMTAVMAIAWMATGATAGAQEPCPVTYCLPTPTPTPTPTPRPESGPKRMTPFPKVRTAGSFAAGRTVFTRVVVRAPKGAKVDARCSSRRCKRTRRTMGAKPLRLRAMQRSFPPGTRLTVRVSGRGVIGKYVSIATRRGKPPVRLDRCLNPGSSKPVRCTP
jgi:hypothetical protein